MLQDITNSQALLRPKLKKPIDGTKYKTELCRNWIELGECQYGDKCNFAHGKDQLMKKLPANQKYKSKACIPFHTKGFCTYGQRCLFLHEKRRLDELPRTHFVRQLGLESRPACTKRLPVFEDLSRSSELAETLRIEQDTLNYLAQILKGELKLEWSPDYFDAKELLSLN